MYKKPVLILGGNQNAVSITRNLGSRGIPVSLASQHNCYALSSKYCNKKYVAKPGENLKDFWSKLLLTQDNNHHSILFACCDEAVEFLAENHERLKTKYLLDHAKANGFVPKTAVSP